MTHLPIHPYLVHPRTGEPLRAIYRTRAGRLIWPQLGAAEDPAPTPPTPPADPAPVPPANPPADPPPKPDDKPLGPGGEKALREEREARKALEKRIAALAPLEQLAEMLGGKSTGDPKTDLEQLTERLDGYERRIAEEQSARWRLEVAAEKGLTPQQAARLTGSTRDELAADADQLLTLFPAFDPSKPRNPAPDPSQGSRGTQPPDLDAQIAAAQKEGDYRKVIALQKQKLANVQR
ncbi:hypothetical protein [Micromonospora zhanjiangensis]|uniref:Lsr2 protein n=1 Tax=Micromonospora zhanjiangensis TaxID=1522057 RepID=A0ABV8KNS3_9ACTN